MSSERPPTIDPLAALRWAARAQDDSAWLHEEVGRRMEERLQWIKLQPQAWADWEPVRGGLAAHAAVARRYPKAQCFVVEAPQRVQVATQTLRKPWWARANWAGPAARFELPPDGGMQMVWANMLLHMSADPQALIAKWHRALGPDGFLMFSCLGPDTLRELRDLYETLGWPPPAHEFTDMHDWGDMLVNAGFAEPVMDMERITLTFNAPERLLLELRQLGRNLHPGRFPGLRGRTWRVQWMNAWLQQAPPATSSGQLPLTFEIIYGHALKPQPRLTVESETFLSLDRMRELLRQGKGAPGTRP
jgi:malonyl-CoA O-methyltransferase